jgi:hypothetical protein
MSPRKPQGTLRSDVMRSFLYASVLSVAAAGASSAGSNVLEATVTQDNLACTDRADALRVVHFYQSDEFPNLEAFQSGMEQSGRCVWWRKGDKVRVSQFENGDGITVAAQRPPDGKFRFFGRCSLESLCR